MPQFAANVSTMFPDVPVAARFAAARAVGFRAVEYLFPYDESPEEIRGRLRDAGIRIILLNTPLGDAAKGERGLAAMADRPTAGTTSSKRWTTRWCSTSR